MVSPSLLMLAVSLAAAAPRPAGAPESPAPLDPSVLSPEARSGWESDPAAFEREHGEVLEVHRRWNQDPSLGQAECIAAKREPRPCMEGRLREMSSVLKPQALAVINSYVKLLPRGVEARVPTAGEEGGGGPAEAAPSTPGRQAPPSVPKPAGARFNSPPPARAATAPPPAQNGKDISTVDEALNWICSYVPCART